MPLIVHFIGPHFHDVDGMLDGLKEFERATRGKEALARAAAIAFGFVSAVTQKWYEEDENVIASLVRCLNTIATLRHTGELPPQRSSVDSQLALSGCCGHATATPLLTWSAPP